MPPVAPSGIDPLLAYLVKKVTRPNMLRISYSLVDRHRGHIIRANLGILLFRVLESDFGNEDSRTVFGLTR
jgi:hypothetical protein